MVVAPERVARGGGLHRSGATDYNQLYLVDLADNRVVRHRGGEGAGASRAEDPRRWKVIPGSLRAHRPAVSPDGSAVAFASGPAPAQQLVVCGLDGANRRVLSSFRDDAMFHGLDWSTDGREIVVSLTRNDQTNLWAVDVASGAWRMLLGGGGAELDPSWGPDGVVFSSDVGGDLEIYRLDVRRGRVEQLTRSVDAAYTPVITPAGHLLYAAWTADGFQARVLPRAERLTFDRTPDFVVGVDADEAARDLAFAPPPGDFAPRRYRASRAILPASAAPFLRADVNPGGLGVSGGAWVDVSDALERHELTLWGLVGDDVAAQASWTLAGRFEIWGTWAVDAQFGDGVVERRSMGEVGASLEVPFNDALAFDAAASVATVGATREVPDVTTLRAELTARVGDEPRRDPGATSKTARLTLRAATSNTTTLGSYEYGRATFEADLAFGLGRPAVDERGLRLDLQTYNAVNSRVVAPDEQLRAGGLSLGALRLSALEVSAPLPGYLAYSSRGDAIALGSGAIAVPVAARPRRSAGGYYLERVEVRLGGDAGLAALYDVGVTPLTDVRVDLRVASTLLQSPFDSVVTVAWAPPLDSPAVGPPQPEIDGLPAAGLRLWVGVGTGF